MEDDTAITNLKKHISEKAVLSEEAVLWLFRKHHSKRTEKDIEDLVNSNLAMVLRIATNFYSKHLSMNANNPKGIELVQLFNAGTEGLYVAIEKFDAYRGTKFSTFAYFWIGQAIRDEIRTSLYPMKTYSYAEVSFKEHEDNKYDKDNPVENTEYKDLIRHIKGQLNEKEKRIFLLYFVQEMTMTEVAEEIGNALGTIQYHLKKIRKKLSHLKG